MKIKDLMEQLKAYNPEAEFCITLPPGWYKEDEAEDKGLWKKGGWTVDSVDYVIVPLDENDIEKGDFVCVCPLKNPSDESGRLPKEI